ncbi:MAG: hypothetical protein IJI68_13645 [Eggerthellaceae bacterium]|nr:hypothetical protein [Eggerthellaceae bacterium]
MTELQRKPIKYYIDFENVHGAGLKGVDALDEHDEVIIIYSQAAETFHIEHAIDILKSKARIEFVEVDGGTRNAADFQLIVALFGAMDEKFDYAIVSGDTGFDAAIKMGERMGLPNVCRLANIRGDIEVEKPEKPKSRRSRRSRSGRDSAAETEPQPQEPQAEDANATPEAQDQTQSDKQAETPSLSTPEIPAKDVDLLVEGQAEEQAAPPKRRMRRRKRSNGAQDGQATVQAETIQQRDEAAVAVEHTADDTEVEAALDAAIEVASDEIAAEAANNTVSAEATTKTASAKTAKTSSAPKKKASSRAREEARQDSAAARARAAEAMKLAFAEPAKAAEEVFAPESVEPTDATEEAVSTETIPEVTPEKLEPTTNPEEQDGASLVKALLAERGVELSDAQLATVTSALDGASGRQDFYHRIIKIERQQKGRALYRQVREHYSALMEALQSQG